MISLPSGVQRTCVRLYLPKFSPLVTASPNISASVVGGGGGTYRSTVGASPRPAAKTTD